MNIIDELMAALTGTPRMIIVCHPSQRERVQEMVDGDAELSLMISEVKGSEFVNHGTAYAVKHCPYHGLERMEVELPELVNLDINSVIQEILVEKARQQLMGDIDSTSFRIDPS